MTTVVRWAEWKRRRVGAAGLRTILGARDDRGMREGMWPPGSVVELLTRLEVLALVGQRRNEYVPTSLGPDVALAVLHLGLQGVFRKAS